MCRWIAYAGKPIFIDQLVTKPSHSLVEQSLQTELNFKTDGSLWATNGDGFGVGWYDQKKEPGLFKDKMPAWNDENLHEICRQTKSHLFLAHIRASTNGSVQRNNSHPFKYNNWLFQHNGDVDHFPLIKRDVEFSILPSLYRDIQGTTDSEACFFLALTHGLQKDPKTAFEKMIRQLEKSQKDASLDVCLNLSCAASDGQKIYTIRYASGTTEAKTQFYTTDMTSMDDFGCDTGNLLPKGGVVLVSEPLNRFGDKWHEIPENSFVVAENETVSVQALNV